MEKNKRKTDNKKQVDNRGNSGQKVGRGVLLIYFIIMTVFYPYYAPGGYLRIGEAKYVFFMYATLAAVVMMSAVTVYTMICDPGLVTGYVHRMSVTDWFAYGYFVAVMLSYLCSDYKDEALLGAEGWHMGAVTQMLFVLLYFFFSRYFVCSVRWLTVWLAAASGVFLLGILNRYSIYPIVMEGQTPVFISTLGNINWFCGYWSVTAAIGMALYWGSKKRWRRATAGVYCLLAVLVGVVQGSESAYLVFAAVYVALLLFSIHSVQRFFRWIELCLIFVAGCQLGRLLRYLPGFEINYGSAVDGAGPSVMDWLTDGNAALWVFCILVLFYALLRLWFGRKCLADRDEKADCKAMRGLFGGSCKRKICAAVVVVLLCGGVSGLLYTSGLWYHEESVILPEQSSERIIVFNEYWGNGRGVAWNCAIDAYGNLDVLHKVFGVGPDCFAAFIYEQPVLAKRLMEEFGLERLTNAHNEALSFLVNVGVFGFVCYAGFVGSALVRYCRAADGQMLLYVCAAGLVAYTVHNIVSFQQVLSTPFFFILLGMGEGLLREEKEKL